MASAPTVQNLNDLIAQYTTAQAPQQSALDAEETQNETSGNAQVAGLDQAKTNAFGQIEQNAANKGMYFSGFSPNAQATYTGSTYLPALAKVQQTIAGVRNTLLGKKADLVAAANSSAINEQKAEQSSLDSYNMELQREEAQRQLQAQSDAAANTRARIASGGGGGGNPASDVHAAFQNFLNTGGKLSASNTKNNRQAQDAYLKGWMLDNGIVDPGAQNQIWGYINQSFGRSNDPTKDWTYKR